MIVPCLRRWWWMTEVWEKMQGWFSMSKLGSCLLISSKWHYFWNSEKETYLFRICWNYVFMKCSSLDAWILRIRSFLKAILWILRHSDLLQSHSQRTGKDRGLGGNGKKGSKLTWPSLAQGDPSVTPAFFLYHHRFFGACICLALP